MSTLTAIEANWTWVHYKLLELASEGETPVASLVGQHEFIGFPDYPRTVIHETPRPATAAAIIDLIDAGAVVLKRRRPTGDSLPIDNAAEVLRRETTWAPAEEDAYAFVLSAVEPAASEFLAARPDELNPKRPASSLRDRSEVGWERAVIRVVVVLGPLIGLRLSVVAIDLVSFAIAGAVLLLVPWWLFGMWYVVPILALVAAGLYVPVALLVGVWQGWRGH